ncbi:MAG: hypothetical protein NTW19_14595 [Planctomycetota bacterium]|nr:hypothetical protein [Planctomycetota bacterium]
MGILRQILAADASVNGYGFRCDGHYIQNRGYGDPGIDPHGGGPAVGPIFAYQCKNRQIYSGLTRVVWELNEVERGNGGTLLMSGSHKANWNVPDAHLKKDSWLFETYACPPGSLLFFTENLCHSGSPWLNKKHNRLAVFNAYTAADTQYHKLGWPHEVIEAMPPKRQSLFRGVWRANFGVSPTAINDTYSPTNRAL